MTANRCVGAARELAENIRYSGDTLRHYAEEAPSISGRVLGSVYQNELRVSSEVTPGLAGRLKSVCYQLHLPADSVKAFIHASPDIKAECYSGGTQNCILRFSSALIDLLDDDEFMFVVGHEIGHFLLGHGLARIENSADSIEYLIQQRAQEISSDRVGLIGCRSLDVAIRAMMKTVSGLTDEHLRFDVNAFLRQLDETPHTGGHHASTHPTFFVRCRALLWFSLNDAFNRGGEDFCCEELSRLDQRIRNDLDKYVDGPAREIIAEAEKNLLLWVVADHTVQDGVLDRKEQKAIAKLVGDETLERFKKFLSDIPVDEAQDEVYQRMKMAREDLERMIPTSFEVTFREIEERVSSALGQ
jgi:hypothetical protein